MAGRTFLGTLRLALLLVVLAFVALGAWLDRARSRDWDAPLRVTVYPLAAGNDAGTQDYVGRLGAEDFSAVPEFFAREAERHGLPLASPVQLRVSHAAAAPPPPLGDRPGVFSVMAWSLRLRWYAARVAWNDPLPTPDVQVFAHYAPLGDATIAVPDSVGLSKGLVAVAHLYAAHEASASNQVVVAHELLHTLGATDKYAPGSGQPLVPDGLGEPGREPLYPQSYAEIMAGRIALGADAAAVPESLRQAVLGPVTAREIGWIP
ncbi:MAG TPA: hypothetical protein VFI92_14185 [Steroidobacteraceae bacterium]|nr:hypothetical protein [Steroidobacteraceae bacterium]